MEKNLYQRLIDQLNPFVSMLYLSSEQHFNLINTDDLWFSSFDNRNKRFHEYQQRIFYSFLLLGYSFWEGFLSDIVRQILSKHPKKILRSNSKEQRKLEYLEIFNCEDNSKDIIEYLIDKEIRKVVNGSMRAVFEYFETNLQIVLTNVEDCVEYSLIRNCIIHNQGIITKELASQNNSFKFGEKLVFTKEEVNRKGLAIREAARILYEQTIEKYNLHE